MLDPAAEKAGYRHLVHETLDSTNEEGLARLRAGDPGKLWLRAEVQSRGRGRGGRAWSSPAGNLYASLLLVDPADMRYAPQLGFVAGVALARAVRRLPGMGAGARLKWPNDLLHEGAKLAGILVEGLRRADGRFACVVGFGVNCRAHPRDLDYRATNLSEASGTEQSADLLLRHLSAEMAAALDLWDRAVGFPAIRDAWLSHALPPGARLTARTASAVTEGTFDTIDDGGRLVLRTPSGPALIEAADVFLARDGEPAAVATR